MVTRCSLDSVSGQSSPRSSQVALDDLKAAQRRAAAAADAERRRIERDLHDGAQQRLMAIRIELGLLAERVDPRQADMRRDLDRLRMDVDAALDEIRELAHGLRPPVLASDGLYPALSAASRHAPIEVTVDGKDVGRLAPDIENAAYFCCMEALQNVAKHAGPHARAWVYLEVRRGALEFRVSDDGPGFDDSPASNGNGLTNVRDRLSTVGGHAEVASTPGSGTVVSGHIPLRRV
jgi:signal transduction histidine kinase